MSDTPPRLSKSMNGLSIEVQRGQENPERKEKKSELENIRTEKKKVGDDINTSLRNTVSDASFDISKLSLDELNALKNSPEVEKIKKELGTL